MKTGYVGNGIRQVRDEAHISQEKLAELLGIKRYELSYYENGRTIPSFDTVLKMAEVLGCTVGDLYRPAILELIKRGSE